MRNRGFGVLFVLTLIICSGTVVQDFRFDALLERAREATLSVDREIGDAATALADLHAAQAGYVATGQGASYWMDRATDLFTHLETTIASLRSSTTSQEAGAHYDAALAALKDLKGVDARARADVNGDRKYEASDRIFTDTREANERLAAEIGAGRAAELAAGEAAMTRLGRIRIAMNAIALAFALAVAVFYWRARTQAAGAIADEPVQEPAGSLRLTPIVVPRPPATVTQETRAAATAAPATTATTTTAATGAAAATGATAATTVTTGAGVNLRGAAELCVDLARVIDSRDVPALLERAASVLGAKGLILWMTDAGGALLRPTVAHGYSDRVITKMGALQVDGDNVTSLAFRSLRGQTVNGAAAASPGAIAVPLITPTGCIGVLAAEVHRQKPTADTVDLARIIAAQLAALVVPSIDASRAAQG